MVARMDAEKQSAPVKYDTTSKCQRANTVPPCEVIR